MRRLKLLGGTLECLLLACLALLLTGSFRVAQAVEPGLIIDVRQGQPIDEVQLLRQLGQAPMVFIGEKHDNPQHHALEETLLQHLVDGHTRVVFEMLDSRLELLPATQAMTADQIRSRLEWRDDNGWPWQAYGRLFEATLQGAGVVAGGNIDRSALMQIYRGDSDYRNDPGYRSVIELQPQLETPLLDIIYQAHCQQMPKAGLAPMVTIQLVRDATMAQATLTAAPKHILISGAMHARKDIGVPRHRQLLSPNTHPAQLTILLEEANPLLSDWHDYENAVPERADFIWFTTAVTPEEDYCATLQRQ